MGHVRTGEVPCRKSVPHARYMSEIPDFTEVEEMYILCAFLEFI